MNEDKTIKKTIDKTDWQRRSALLDEVSDLPKSARAAWFEALEKTEPTHVAAIQKMLGDFDTSHSQTSHANHPPSLIGVGAQEFTARLDVATCVVAATHADVALQPGDNIGAWQLERKIGEGGMGAVWLAARHDGNFNGVAAIKFLRGGLGKTEVVERFLRERRLLARLTHTGIARMLDAGTHEGEPYLVMEYVDGLPITEWVASHAPRVADRVALLLKVCRAAEHAHAQLIVHRDLKPSNVLVTKTGEPSLLDFGIAKLIDEGDDEFATALTRITGRGFTLGYCAPEQITGEPTGVAADVFSMGVLLFELLTGTLPFKSASNSEGRAALEHAIVHSNANSISKTLDEKTPLRKNQPSDAVRAKGDLEAIVDKALRKKPADRYPTLSAFAGDLDRWLNNLPVAARRGNWQYKTGLWLKRNRTLAVVTSIAFVAVSVGLLAAIWQTERANAEALRANTEASRADQERETAVTQRRRAEIATAQAAAALSDANEQKNRASNEAQRADKEAGDTRRALVVAARNERRATQQEAMAKDQSLMAKNESAKAVAVQKYLLDIFKKNSTSQPNPVKAQQTTVRELLDSGVKDIDNVLVNQPDAKLLLLDAFSQLYNEIGVREQSILLASKKRALVVEKYGLTSDQMFDATAGHLEAILAQDSRQLSAVDSDAATAMYLQLTALLDKRGENNSIRRSQLYKLACAFRNSGKFGGEPSACEKWLNMLAIHHRDSIEYAEALVEMSHISASRQEFSRQETFASEAIFVLRAQKRDELELVEPLGSLIQVRLRTFQMKAAEQASVELVRILETSKTPLASKIFTGYKTYAQVMRSSFRFAEARDILKRAVVEAQPLYGASNSLAFLSLRVELASTLSQMGDLPAALSEYEEVMSILERDSADTGFHAINLVFYGAALAKNGNDTKAREVMNRAQRIFEKSSFGTDAAIPILRSAVMAELELRAGRADAALVALNDTILRNLKPSASPNLQVIRRQALLGRILVAQGNLGDADNAIMPHLSAIESSPVREHLAMLEADLLFSKATLQTARDQHENAIESLARAVTLYARREIAQSPLLVEKKFALIRAYVRAGRHADARALMASMEAIRNTVIAPNQGLAQSYASLAANLDRVGAQNAAQIR